MRGAARRWPGVAWLDSFPLAATLARRSRRPILLGVFDPAVPGSAAMERTSLAEPRIARFVGERFVAVRVDPGEAGGAPGGLPPWAPALLHLDPDGRRFRSAIGYLPPPALAAELRIALGHRSLLAGRPAEALAWFERAAEADSALAAEALYWAGVAAYRARPRDGGLRERWDALRAAFPGSPWAERCDLEPPLPPRGEPTVRGRWAEAWRAVRRTIAAEWER